MWPPVNGICQNYQHWRMLESPLRPYVWSGSNACHLQRLGIEQLVSLIPAIDPANLYSDTDSPTESFIIQSFRKGPLEHVLCIILSRYTIDLMLVNVNAEFHKKKIVTIFFIYLPSRKVALKKMSGIR